MRDLPWRNFRRVSHAVRSIAHISFVRPFTLTVTTPIPQEQLLTQVLRSDSSYLDARVEQWIRHLFPLVWVLFPLVWAFFPLVRPPSHLNGFFPVCIRLSLGSQTPFWGTKKKKTPIPQPCELAQVHCHPQNWPGNQTRSKSIPNRLDLVLGPKETNKDNYSDPEICSAF